MKTNCVLNSKASLPVLFMLFFGVIFISCQKDALSPITSQKTLGTVTVKDGRLFFSSKELYSATINNKLINKSEQEIITWLAQFDFKPLSSSLKQENYGLPFYKYLLNENHQIRVENTIIQIVGDSVYNVPAENDALVTLLTKNPNSSTLLKYKFSALKRNDFGSPSMNNARIATGRAGDVFDQTSDANAGTNTGGTQFRYFIDLSAYCDGSTVTFQVQNSLQYFWSGHGWYYASEYAHCEIASFNYNYYYYVGNNLQVSSGSSPGGVSERTGNSARVVIPFYSFPNGDGHVGQTVQLTLQSTDWFRSDNIQFPTKVILSDLSLEVKDM